MLTWKAKKKTYAKEEGKSFNRYHAVMSALDRIPNMDQKDCLYLVGRLSGLEKLDKAHNHLPVRTMAVYLERLSKTLTPERRKEAVLKAWQWMTGYDSYEAAYENEDETREFTDEEVKESMIRGGYRTILMRMIMIRPRSSWKI